MKKNNITLPETNIIFEPDTHTYTNQQGNKLCGVTTMLRKYLFADKYKGVPADVLKHAAQHGTRVHEQTQLAICGFKTKDTLPETKAIIKTLKQNKLTPIEAEYLITDNQTCASSIDIVLSDKNQNITLADIKTTETLDTEYVAWQLSIYAYLFEQQTNHPVTEIIAIHARNNTATIHTIKRIPDTHIAALIEAQRTHATTFTNPLKQLDTETTLLTQQAQIIEQKIATIKQTLDNLTMLQTNIKEKLYNEMQMRSIKKWDTDTLSITLKEPSVRTTIDADKLRTLHPRIYKQTTKQTQTKGTVLIKLKQTTQQNLCER